MSKTIFLWLVLAIFCGGALFYVSQKTRDAREKLSSVTKEVENEKEAIRVFSAEWSYLNQPQRLEMLAKKYLDTKSMHISQFVDVDSIVKDSRIIVAAPRHKRKTRIAKVRLKNHILDRVVKTKDVPEKVSIAKRGINKFKTLINIWGNE